MPSSKLDYLSKYADPPSGGNSKKEKKKKNKKGKKEKKRSTRDYYDSDDDASAKKTKRTSMLLADEDYEAEKNSNGDGSDFSDEDNNPVVVPAGELGEADRSSSSLHQPRGTWQVEGMASSAKAASKASSKAANKAARKSPKSRSDQKQQKRYDSSDEDDDDDKSAASNGNQRKRYDSSDEDSVKGKVANADSDLERRRRKRHDSDDESDKSDRPRRKRADSASSDDRPRRRYDSDDDQSEPKSATRKRYDSDEDPLKPDPVPSRRSKKARYDSDSPSPVRSKRYDSDASPSPVASGRKQRYDSSDDEGDKNSKQKMESGHTAGLQNAQAFTKAELKIQDNKQRDAQHMVDKYGMGDTVYRDARGLKTDDPAESQGPAKPQLSATDQKLLNTGRTQLEKQRAKAKDLAELQESSFARREDDDKLEDYRKNIIYKDDPMAEYEYEKRQKEQKRKKTKGEVLDTRPVYKGPPAKPNRYGVRPGYRWDGTDRGNGFEDKLLAQTYGQQHRKESAYRYRSSGM